MSLNSCHFNVRVLILLLLFLNSYAFSGQVQIATFNIWGAPFIWSNYKEERINKICLKLKKLSRQETTPDIFFIQEAWASTDRNSLKNCGYRYSIDLDKGNNDSGLLILSKYPLFYPGRHVYRNHPGILSSEYFINKSILWAQVLHPSAGAVWLFNTHLAEDKPEFQEIRQKQALELKYVIQIIAQKSPTIFGGDLNTGPIRQNEASLWNSLSHIFSYFRQYVDSTQQNACTYCKSNTFADPYEDSEKLDHLFASHQFRATSGSVIFNEKFSLSNGEKINLSDHFGFASSFNIDTTTAVPIQSIIRYLPCNEEDYLTRSLENSLEHCNFNSTQNTSWSHPFNTLYTFTPTHDLSNAFINIRINPGLNPNTVLSTQSNITLLHYLAGTTFTNWVRFLLKNGANPQLRDSQGRTPLDVANEYQNHSMALLLSSVTKK